MATKMTAPFKRGTKLLFGKKEIPVKYVKWMGFERSALIVVEDANGARATVHVNDVKPVPV